MGKIIQMNLINLNQIQLFFIFLISGFLLFIPLSILYKIIKFKQKTFILFLLDLCSTIYIFSCLIYLSNKFTLGEVRFFTILGYFVGILLETKTVGNLLGIFIKKIYNLCRVVYCKLSTNGIFKKLFK